MCIKYLIKFILEGDFGERVSSGDLLEESNDVSTFLGLLESSEAHLGLWDVLLWILEVFEEGVVSPDDVGVLVGLGVGVSLHSSGLSSKQSVEVWSLLVGTSLLVSVALSTASLEQLLSSLHVSLWLLPLLGSSSSQSENEVERGLLLDVVVCEGSVVLELLSCKNESLLIWWDSFFFNKEISALHFAKKKKYF